MCKQRVVCTRSHWDHDGEEADDENEVSESTPLLHSMASASTHSVSITSEASAFSRDGESSDTEDDALDEIRQEEGGVVVVEELVQIQQNLPLE